MAAGAVVQQYLTPAKGLMLMLMLMSPPPGRKIGTRGWLFVEEPSPRRCRRCVTGRVERRDAYLHA